ncbi:MAG: MgtC/SapB family protein [Candidatus Aenigmarchaeota archaeon]|nr:MgtC/SapB family protein [Candidatus Aenigmarchaeota archaeon]
MNIGIDSMTLEFILRIFVSLLLGALVGLEREMTGKPAGLRTHIFVSMGACLFTISSFYLTGSMSVDSSRIAAGIVTGIGFIGAGSIIATHGRVRGLTTAASLWIVSAIGLMVGLGNYILSTLSAVLVFIVLRLGKIEREVEDETGKTSKRDERI